MFSPSDNLRIQRRVPVTNPAMHGIASPTGRAEMTSAFPIRAALESMFNLLVEAPIEQAVEHVTSRASFRFTTFPCLIQTFYGTGHHRPAENCGLEHDLQL